MTCSEGGYRALAVGPAAALELGSGRELRVHSVFPGAINLASPAGLVTLTGPAGCGLPHTVAILRPGGFPAWRLLPDGLAQVRPGQLELPAQGGPVRIDLAGAERPPVPVLARVPGAGPAHRACLAWLARHQAETGCALAIGAAPPSPLAKALQDRVRELLGAAEEPLRLGRAVAALVGLGPGLTPAGDDVLCGFLAAAGPALAPVLGAAMAANLARTGLISAHLMRLALRGHRPAPLAALAAALAAEAEPEALAALAELCRYGHSSGADLASGYLTGLAVSAPGFLLSLGDPNPLLSV